MSTNSENKWYINDAVQYIKDNNIPEEALKSLVINSPLYGQMSLMDAINSNLKGYWDANEMKDLIDKKHTSYQQQKHTSYQQQKRYPVFTGYGGMQYASSPEEQAEMQEQANLNKASDPSENFVNDLMVFGPKILTTVGKGLWSLGKGSYDLSKSLLQSIAEQGIKETGKRFAYQTGKGLLKSIPGIAGSIVGGYGVDKTSEALTDKTWDENVSDFLSHRWGFDVPTIVGDMTNPGYYAGFKYGNFLGTNFANRERYVLNYLTPAGYDGHGKELFKVFTAPFYKKPPKFHNGKKPEWYDKYSRIYGKQAAENRFQNGAIWANIPEEEIPRTMYVRNSDGTYRLTREGLNLREDGTLKFPLPNESEPFPDLFSIGQVGGEHSQYTLIDKYRGTPFNLMEFEDIQKLNPQWQFTDKIKNKFGETSKIHKWLHNIGGKDLGKLMFNYKPFTIRQHYFAPQSGISAPYLPSYTDPDRLWTLPKNVNYE